MAAYQSIWDDVTLQVARRNFLSDMVYLGLETILCRGILIRYLISGWHYWGAFAILLNDVTVGYWKTPDLVRHHQATYS